jgi:hypothetical protein
VTDSPPSRLDLLYFARRVVEQQARASLAQLDAWIAVERRREDERRNREARRPAPPEWLIERGIGVGAPPTRVHCGGCYMAPAVRVRPVTEDQARRALYEHVDACSHCNPDTELRVILE